MDFFNEKYSKQTHQLFLNIFYEKPFSPEMTALNKLVQTILDKEMMGKTLSHQEQVLIDIQSNAYLEYLDNPPVDCDAKFSEMAIAEHSLQQILKHTSIQEIMAQKPSFDDAGPEITTIALKIDGLDWQWVFSQNSLQEAMFALHEYKIPEMAVSLEQKKAYNQKFLVTGCKCPCHNPAYQMTHIMPCCSMTCKKLFTNLID